MAGHVWLLLCLVVLTVGMYCLTALTQPPAEGVAFYVSPKGDDSWMGRREAPNADRTDGPFATVECARDAIRALPPEVRDRSAITAYLRGGRYFLTAPLSFEPRDSGSERSPVTYQAYPAEIPVISGGRVIAGWQKGEGPIWKTVVPGVKEGQWCFRELFVNGRRTQRARTPNSGFLQVDGDISQGPQASFTFRDADIDPAWADRGDVEIIALQAWAEIRMPIIAVEPSARRVVLAGKCRRSNREADARYWVENAREALDSPGEWYLDRHTGELSYWPLPGEDMTQAEVIAPALNQLVLFNGDPSKDEFVSDLRLRGLTFGHTDWSMGPAGYADQQAAYDIPAALEANGARSVTIEGCSFSHLGGYAVAFARGCRDNLLIGNEIADIGAGGIKIGEAAIRTDERENTGSNDIQSNDIHDIGVVYPAGVGLWVGQSGGNTIRRNHIHDTYYSGISVGWTWGYGAGNARDNIVEDNHVHDIGRGMLSDMGGIYTLGVQPGTVIRGNVFHDINSHGYGGWGIYLDEGSTNILVEDNIVYRTKTGGFHQHYGRENTIRGNIFAFSREGQIIRTRMEDHLSFTFERNIVYWNEGHLLGGKWSDSDHYRLDHNLYFNAAGGPVEFAGSSFAEWQARGQDQHSIIADPLFRDPSKGDFRLKPGSPALTLGFREIGGEAKATE